MRPTIYVGSKGYDKIGFKLQNTLITGRARSGKTITLNNIIEGLLETCNPDRHALSIVDVERMSVWGQCVNEKRYDIPLIIKARYWDAEHLDLVFDYFDGLLKDRTESGPGYTLIVVVDEFQMINSVPDPDHAVETINRLISHGPSVDMYFIFSSQDCMQGRVTGRIDTGAFTLRIGTTYDDGQCRELFHEHTQTAERKEREGRYQYDIQVEEKNGRRIFGIIPAFKPNTFLRKLCRAYSVGKR